MWCVSYEIRFWLNWSLRDIFLNPHSTKKMLAGFSYANMKQSQPRYDRLGYNGYNSSGSKAGLKSLSCPIFDYVILSSV
jgi:hypothetical protein